MAKLNPYLTFDGNCREAMNFYKDCLGGELKIMTVGESPVASQLPKEFGESVMHANLESASMTIMASDRLSSDPRVAGNTVTLMLGCSSASEIETLFAKLAEGGKVNTHLRTEFWGATYGDITDRFGFRWMLNFEKQKA